MGLHSHMVRWMGHKETKTAVVKFTLPQRERTAPSVHTHTHTRKHACTHMCMAQDIEEGTGDSWGQAAEKEEHSFPQGACRGGRKTPTTPSATSKLSSWQLYLVIC